MKLVDILARELNEWPKAFGDVLGQRCDGTLHGYNDAGFVTWIGETPQLTRCDNYMHNIVTRAQWQEARGALIKPEQTQWNGEGPPPVGTVCTCHYQGGYQGKVRVEFIGKNACVLLNLEHGDEQCGMTEHYVFKPIRTPEQLAAEARESGARQICIDAMADPFDEPTESQMTVARRLYDKGYRIFEIVDEEGGK